MKKIFVSLLLCLSMVATVSAYEMPGFEWGVDLEATTAYLWRGLNYGGLAFQPAANVGYAGLNLEMWWNLSPADYTFSEFAPELDMTLSYSIVGITVGVTHQYYFDGSKYFSFGKTTGNQTEVFGEFNLEDLLEDYPLHFGWYTMIGGDDFYEETNSKGETVEKRAYSSYFDVSYEFGLPLGFSLTPTVGFTPWKSLYNYYDSNFSVNNVQLRADWKLEVFKHMELDVYAQLMLNTAGLNKHNIITGVGNTYSEDAFSQRLNFNMGLALSFY